MGNDPDLLLPAGRSKGRCSPTEANESVSDLLDTLIWLDRPSPEIGEFILLVTQHPYCWLLCRYEVEAIVGTEEWRTQWIDDLVQAIHTALLESLRESDKLLNSAREKSAEEFLGWVRLTIRNVAHEVSRQMEKEWSGIKKLRRANASAYALEQIPDPSGVESAVFAKEMWLILKGFPEQISEAFSFAAEGLSRAEVAARLGISMNQLIWAVRKELPRLRKQFEPFR